MTANAGTREERFAPLFFSAILMAVCAATSVAAQTVTSEELIECSAFETDAAKLACYEALTARFDQPEKVEKVTGPLSGESAESPDPEPVAEASLPAPETPPVAAAAAPEKEPIAPIAPEPEKRPKFEPVTAIVERVRAGSRFDKRLYFEFENGEVWRQMEYSRFPYPRSGPFEVVVSQGVMGDFRLRVDGKGRMTRIVRVK